VSPYRAWPFLSDPGHPFLSAVWAVLVHGCICLVAIGPIVWRSDHRIGYALLAFVGGSAIDLDHFVAAGSLNLRTIETLGGRPDTHSLVFVLVLGLLTLILTRRWLLAWAMFAVNLAHLLFDAAGGGVHVLYPLKHPDGLPWLVSPVGTLALLGASAAIAGRSPRPGPRGARGSQRDALPVG
jgi:LexA-binding, inner membrane-associated putative hydrolase